MRIAVYLVIFYFVGLLVVIVPSLIYAMDIDGLLIVGLSIWLLLWGYHKAKK